ncbi:Uncharacterised protein [Klebsiella pneumoniae]|nr:Uncharacterised protein [Klebsiella pneumoniae]VAP21945.1 Uncharacterised protein [Klebsiella pneumoniae]
MLPAWNIIIMATINNTSNTNTTTTDKGQNGFCILSSLYNTASNSYIQKYQALTFDSTPSTGIRRQADVTSYPVENGADVSDHVQIRNNTFKLSGMITETPIRAVRDLLYSAGVNGTRISQAITYLDQIFEARQPIILTVFCKNGDITNPELSGGKMPDAGRNMTWDLRAPAPTPSHLRATVAIKGSFRGAEF